MDIELLGSTLTVNDLSALQEYTVSIDPVSPY